MAGLSSAHEENIKKFTDKIMELCATDIAIIDDPDEDMVLTPEAFRATLIAIRNNALMVEDFVESEREKYR